MDNDLIDFGFKNHYGRLKHWKAIFEEWFLLLKRYCRSTSGKDAPFWYNERSNIGILSVAAYRCGFIALEEYQCTKGRGANKRNGRADLWIASDFLNTAESVEGKFAFISLTSKDIAVFVTKRIELAIKDVKKVNEESNKIALVFLSVYLQTNKMHEFELLFKNFKSEIKKVTYDVLAWCFPTEARYLKVTNKYYPGVFVVGRKV